MYRREFFEARILIVDDEPQAASKILSILKLGGLHSVLSETDSCKALGIFDAFKPDLVILDFVMQRVDGMDVLVQLRPKVSSGECMPILIVSGDITLEAKEATLSAGAMDFLSKPFEASEVLLRVKNLLRTRQLYLELRREKDSLDERILERTSELEQSRNEVVERLGLLADFRDDATGRHTRRVGSMVREIALEMSVNRSEAELMGKAALLHDIGKVAVPDSILLKPGRLNEQEFSKMKKHSSVGGDILKGSTSMLLQEAELIARFHHERWNGDGYESLSGEEIPLAARITAVSDVYDALVSERPYKPAWDQESALAEIRRVAGSHFDPNVVDAFFRVMNSVYVA